MRLLEVSYGDVRIFSERIFGYKRYIVEYPDNKIEVYSSLWYKLDKIKEIVEKYLNSKD
mgnify:FL=1|tara:strand:- start:110 stop:286 length:177 start_codon:yes stop_codon:yes gene_type:complete